MLGFGAERTDRRLKFLLWGLITVAFGVRIWGTWYGLPFSYWVDEYHEVMRALELGTGGFNLGRTSKGGFYFLLFFEYGIYFLFLKLSGIVATAQDFAEQFVRDPSAFYLMGRVTAVVIGCATVATVFCLAQRAYSTIAGLFAAAFLAINILHIDLSRRIGVDIPMSFFVTLALYYGLQVAEHGRRSDYLLAALCAALAATTKLPGALVLLPLLIAHTYYVARAGGGVRTWFGTRDLWLAAAVFLAVLVATNPGILARTGYLSLFLDTSDAVMDEGIAGVVSTIDESARPNLYSYYFGVLRDSMGWPLVLLAVASVAYAVWKRTTADVILLSYAAINYIIISSTVSTKLYFPRYALPIVIVVIVLSGRLLGEIAQSVARHRVVKLAVILAGLMAYPVWQAMLTGYALMQTDTRTVAKDWIEANVPFGSDVLIEGLKIAPIKGTVQLIETPEAINRRIAYWKAREPKQARFLELQNAVHPGGGYNLTFARPDSFASLDDFVQQGIEYFVVRPEYFFAPKRAGQGGAGLVSELQGSSRVTLLKQFEGDSRTQLGPTIEIYRLLQNPKVESG